MARTGAFATRRTCLIRNRSPTTNACRNATIASKGSHQREDVDRAYEQHGAVYDYFRSFGRDSIDNNGLPLIATVRYCPLANDPATPDDDAELFDLQYAAGGRDTDTPDVRWQIGEELLREDLDFAIPQHAKPRGV